MTKKKYATEEERKEAVRGYKRAYVQRHPERRLETTRKYDAYNKDKAKQYRADNFEHIKKRVQENNTTRRNEFLEMYGSKCECCGETENIFLTLDHIKGQKGIPIAKKERGVNSYRSAIAEYRPDTYRILCMNCNFATRFEGAICPHQK